jgi:hypothetical protein
MWNTVSDRLRPASAVEHGLKRQLHHIRNEPQTIQHIALTGSILPHEKSEWLQFQSSGADASETLENKGLDTQIVVHRRPLPEGHNDFPVAP